MDELADQKPCGGVACWNIPLKTELGSREPTSLQNLGATRSEGMNSVPALPAKNKKGRSEDRVIS